MYYTKRKTKVKTTRNLSVGDEISYLGFRGKVIHVFDGREYSNPHFEYTILTDENPSRIGYIYSSEFETKLRILDTNHINRMNVDHLVVIRENSIKHASLNDIVITIEYDEKETEELVPVEPGTILKDLIQSYEVLYVTPHGSLVVTSSEGVELYIDVNWQGYTRFYNLCKKI